MNLSWANRQFTTPAYTLFAIYHVIHMDTGDCFINEFTNTPNVWLISKALVALLFRGVKSVMTH